VTSAAALWVYAAAHKDTGANPYGIAALGVGVLVLVILLITFRRR